MGEWMQDLTDREKRQVRDAAHLIERMLCVNPRERPSCAELLRDKFFTDETSVEALRSTPPERLKGVKPDVNPGATRSNGMCLFCVPPRVPVSPTFLHSVQGLYAYSL
jgi:serine/threonine protein kinase